MHPNFDLESQNLRSLFEDYLKTQSRIQPAWVNPVWEYFSQAESHALFGGGKRFRPLLSLFTAKDLHKDLAPVLPFASAVERIHSYSLVHDDLPCMDDDDFRRGQPTNHKVYGEALALLAGDSLLTEAFYHLGEAYRERPEIGLELVRLLGEASGRLGMIAGQVMDISEDSTFKNSLIERIHALKTGALIRVAVEGAAVVCGCGSSQKALFREFGEHLGLAFQLADDILDFNPAQPESTSFVSSFGLERTQGKLVDASRKALDLLKELEVEESLLASLVEWNLIRKN